MVLKNNLNYEFFGTYNYLIYSSFEADAIKLPDGEKATSLTLAL